MKKAISIILSLTVAFTSAIMLAMSAVPVRAFEYQAVSEIYTQGDVIYDIGLTAGTAEDPYWLFGLDCFVLNKGEESESIKVEAEAYESKSDSVGIAYDSGTGTPVLSAWDDGVVVYKDVDITDLQSVSFFAGSDTKGGYVELRTDSADGYLISRAFIENTGGWQSYRIFEGDKFDLGGMSGVHDLYVIFDMPSPNTINRSALEIASASDAVVVCVGTNDSDSREGFDRSTLVLPDGQDGLINAVCDVNDNVIVYINAVGQIDISRFKDKAEAIVWCAYNGQQSGGAFASVLFGETNPSGRLPVTWYKNDAQLGNIAEYDITAGLGKTYQYFNGEYDYPFGYGLSYTAFELSNVNAPAKADANEKITITADVKNTGGIKGKQTVQIYAKNPTESLTKAKKRLVGFTQVELNPDETKQIAVYLNMSRLMLYNEREKKQQVENGEYTFFVAVNADDEENALKVNVNGKLVEKINVLTFTSGQIWAKQGEQVDTSLTASLTDETMLDIENAQVTYISSNPDVATISDDGKITCVSAGVATVTATVEYNGETKTASLPIAVKTGAQIVSAEMASLPDTLKYVQGGALDVSGGTVRILYSDDSSETVDLTEDMCELVDMNTGETKSVTVKIGNASTSFRIEIDTTYNSVYAYPVNDAGKWQLSWADGSFTAGQKGLFVSSASCGMVCANIKPFGFGKNPHINVASNMFVEYDIEAYGDFAIKLDLLQNNVEMGLTLTKSITMGEFLPDTVYDGNMFPPGKYQGIFEVSSILKQIGIDTNQPVLIRGLQVITTSPEGVLVKDFTVGEKKTQFTEIAGWNMGDLSTFWSFHKVVTGGVYDPEQNAAVFDSDEGTVIYTNSDSWTGFLTNGRGNLD